jgi:hypothetical protein
VRANDESVDDVGAESNHRRSADLNVATQGRTRRNVCEVSNKTIVINRCARVDDAMGADACARRGDARCLYAVADASAASAHAVLAR